MCSQAEVSGMWLCFEVRHASVQGKVPVVRSTPTVHPNFSQLLLLATTVRTHRPNCVSYMKTTIASKERFVRRSVLLFNRFWAVWTVREARPRLSLLRTSGHWRTDCPISQVMTRWLDVERFLEFHLSPLVEIRFQHLVSKLFVCAEQYIDQFWSLGWP